MKKIISLILSLVMMLSFTACGTKAEATWQEHYDLGLKYVNEAKYEEAILSFTKALEIDPKQAPVYIALAEVYVRQENYTAAQETLDKAITEIGETDELLAEKDNLNNKQTPQNNNISGEGGIPPQIGPFPSADAVLGVVETDRHDIGDGIYLISGYNAEGYEICQYWYNADGSLDDYFIYTLDVNGNRIRTDHYKADGSLNDYFIWTYDANDRCIRDTWYYSDGDIYTFEYLYTDGSPVVTMRYTREYDGVTGSTELTHTMANPENSVGIGGWGVLGAAEVSIDWFTEFDNYGNWSEFDYENGVITRRDS